MMRDIVPARALLQCLNLSGAPRLSWLGGGQAALRNRCTQELPVSPKLMMVIDNIPAPAILSDGHDAKASQMAVSAVLPAPRPTRRHSRCFDNGTLRASWTSRRGRI